MLRSSSRTQLRDTHKNPSVYRIQNVGTAIITTDVIVGKLNNFVPPCSLPNREAVAAEILNCRARTTPIFDDPRRSRRSVYLYRRSYLPAPLTSARLYPSGWMLRVESPRCRVFAVSQD